MEDNEVQELLTHCAEDEINCHITERVNDCHCYCLESAIQNECYALSTYNA